MSAIVENEPVYILHRRPYKESSFILDIFSLNYGRMAVVANGAGKSASKKSQNTAALLQNFQPLNMSWSGRSAMKTLRHVEAVSQRFMLHGDKLFCAYYLTELLLYLTPEGDAIPELFVKYAQAIEALNGQGSRESILREFEYYCLSTLGLLPNFRFDIYGDEIKLEKAYFLNLEEGFFAAPLSYVEQQKTQPGVAVYEGRLISVLAESSESELTLHKSDFKSAQLLMKSFIDYALNGKELKSRAMFEQMLQQKRLSQ